MPPYGRAYKATPRASTARTRASIQAQKRASYRAGAQAAMRKKNVRTGGFVDVENKFLDCSYPQTALPTSWTAINPAGVGCTGSISVPAQGDGESERDGRVYYINSVHVKGLINVDASESDAGPTGNNLVRIILYWDTQTNAAEATATDIMDAGASTDYLAFRNLQNSKRFIVLKDKTFNISPEHMNEGSANLFANSTRVIQFKMNKKFKKPIKVRTSGTTANVSSCTDNNLGLAAIQTGSGLSAELRYETRIRFSG